VRPDSRFATTVEADLRRLVNSEEVFFGEHVAYSDSLEDLKFRPSNGVAVTIQEATRASWSAIATHIQSPHWVCGIFVGGVSRLERRKQAEPTWWHR